MRLSYYILFIFPILSFLIGCSPSRHLKENQYIIYKQSIKGNKKRLSSEELTPLYRQKENRKFLRTLPYVGIYNFGKNFYDSSKVHREIDSTKSKYKNLIEAEPDTVKKGRLRSKLESKLEKLNTKLRKGNWIMRAPGEPPTIYDSSLTQQTVRLMQSYLFAKGLFQGKVTAEVDTISRKRIKVDYNIVEGPSYKLKKIEYEIADPKIMEIVNKSLPESKLKVYESYDEQKINAERERLNKLMKNNGYYDFTRQFIFFEVDTTSEAQKVDIYIIIKNPADGSSHQQFTIDKIYFNTDVTNIEGAKRDTTYYNGKYYIYYKNNFSKKILHFKTKLNPGELYNQSRVQESQIQLAGLDMYKFININFEKNPRDSAANTLTAHIRTSPFKKFQLSDEWGVNVGQGFIPGPYASLTFKDRNVFKGFEIFEASLRYSLEAVLAQKGAPGDENKPIIMKEYGGNISLTFPKIYFPEYGRKARNYSPKTKIIAGYNFVNRPEYTRATLRTAFTYNWLRSLNSQYNISLIDINIVNTTRIDPGFALRLETLRNLGNNLYVSFKSSVITSFNANYVFNNHQIGSTKRSKYWKPSIEIGGNIVNALSKYVSKEKDNQFLGLQYFEFFKISNDLRYYFPIRKRNTFAMRFNGGYARPYGSSAKNGLFVLPYEKYFFSGGPNSNRAWKPRRLGPGSFKDPYNGYLFEQPGEILIESNFEYRSNLFSFVDWAMFVDAGNVWNIKKDPARPGSQFKFDTFLSQIAVGTGLGLRLDFTFLILRFDIGMKVWDPGERGDNRFALKESLKHPPFTKGTQAVYNIGIGYPF